MDHLAYRPEVSLAVHRPIHPLSFTWKVCSLLVEKWWFDSISQNFISRKLLWSDSGQRFDANVLSCTYSDGHKGETIQLTDEEGCSLRPDLTTVFYKLKETTNPNTDLTLYTYFRVKTISSYFHLVFLITRNLNIFKKLIFLPGIESAPWKLFFHYLQCGDLFPSMQRTLPQPSCLILTFYLFFFKLKN